MLNQTLLRFAQLSENGILYLLLSLSVASVAVILERLLFFRGRALRRPDAVSGKLLAGDFEGARALVATHRGMEGAVLRAALSEAPKGADAVEGIVAGAVLRERLVYERGLAFLGTLGNNAPFIGLLGTVLGIIHAFQDLSVATSGQIAKGPQTVMAGISSALVATAVGLVVALPAVAAFNAFQRQLKAVTSRTHTFGHELVATLRAKES